MVAKPVTIRNVTYPSQAAAAKALGLWSATTIRSAILNGILDTVGTKQPRHDQSIPTNGFPSKKAYKESLSS